MPVCSAVQPFTLSVFSNAVVVVDRVTDLGGFNKLIKARDGFFVANENDLYVGRALIKYGEYSQLEMDLLKQIVKPGDIVADVGANIGGHTIGLSQLTGPTGRVLAFEPQPIIFQTLCANLSLNSLTNVDTFHCGLGDATDIIHIPLYRYDQPFNYAGIGLNRQSQQGTPVDVKTLDDVFRYPRLKLIKIDVEGMEEHVLRGARQCIERFQPVLYLENDRADRSEALIELLLSMGYRLWWHLPPLFNPNNFFADSEDLFPGVASLNMLCLHKDVTADLPDFEEIKEPMIHPILTKAASG